MKQKQLKELIFFIDRCAESNILVETLKQAGAIVERHSDKFLPDSPDTEWLAFCGNNNWLVITRDERIGKNPLELNTVIDKKVSVFLITLKKEKSAFIARTVADSLNAIVKFVSKNEPPFIAKIYRDSSVKHWKP